MAYIPLNNDDSKEISIFVVLIAKNPHISANRPPYLNCLPLLNKLSFCRKVLICVEICLIKNKCFQRKLG